MPDKALLLQRLNLFESMGRQEVEAVARELRMRHYSPGELIGMGQSDRVYLLKEGRVRLFHVTRDGQDITTAVLEPGQLFGLWSLSDREREDEPVTVACLDPCYVCEASAQDFLGILTRHPLLMARVVMVMAKQILRLQAAVESLAAEPARVRVARHLLALSTGATPHDDGLLLPPQTQEEMAKTIASTRETVSRALAALRREGIIAMQGRSVLILDIDGLRAIVDG